jgi:hypothetical protein
MSTSPPSLLLALGQALEKLTDVFLIWSRRLGGSDRTGEIRVVIEIEAVPTTSPPLGENFLMLSRHFPVNLLVFQG